MTETSTPTPGPVARGYGYVPDAPDHRDRIRLTAPRVLARLPRAVDLRATKHLPPVWDQGQLGSCTAHGTLAAFLFAAKTVGAVDPMLSRLQLYYNTRALEGTVDQDAGGQIRDAIKAAAAGLAPEKDWPYRLAKFAVAPPERAVAAATHKAVSYARVVNTVGQLQAALAAGLPFVDGIPVYQSFESDEVASSGRVPMPTAGDQLVGYHCTATVGYDLDADDGHGGTGVWIKRNSWGKGWGMKGYFSVPLAYHSLFSDVWQISAAD